MVIGNENDSFIDKNASMLGINLIIINLRPYVLVVQD